MLNKCILSIFALLYVLSAAHAGEQDPLARALFGPEEVAGVNINPGGNRIAVLKNIDERQVIYIHTIDGDALTEAFDTSLLDNEDAVITGVQWIDDYSLVIGVREQREAIAELDDTRIKHRVLAVSLKEEKDGRFGRDIYALRTNGEVVSPLPREENRFLFGRSRSVSKVYRLDIRQLSELGARLGKLDKIDGGQFVSDNEVTTVDGYVTRWLADSDSQVLGAVAYTDRHEITLWTRGAPNEEWTELKQWNTDAQQEKYDNEEEAAAEEPVYIPVALTDTDQAFYTLHREDDEPPALYRYNYATEEAELIYSGPESRILRPLLSSRTHSLLGVATIENGRLKLTYFADTLAGAADKGAAKFSDSTVSIASAGLSGQKFVLFVSSPRNPGAYHLYDAAQDRLIHLLDAKPQLNDLKPTETHVGEIEHNDLTIEYFLTRPARTDDKFPLIVMPHGGPIGVMDFMGFSAAVQYFAQSGYAVLQVNYRGSAGYSRRLLEAGKREFGTGILDDIEAAIRAAKDRKSVDGERICTVGGSYGGYAALMLPVRQPGRYRCGVSLAGVTDINLLISSADKSTYTRKWFQDYIGDSRENYDKLKSLSPVYSAGTLDLPLYIAHGIKDRIVDPEHSFRLKRMLDALDRDYRWRTFENQGHYFDDYETTADYFQSVRAFIGEHI